MLRFVFLSSLAGSKFAYTNVTVTCFLLLKMKESVL